MNFPANLGISLVERTPFHIEIDQHLDCLVMNVKMFASTILNSLNYDDRTNVIKSAGVLKKFLIETDAKLANVAERTNNLMQKMMPQFENVVKEAIKEIKHDPKDEFGKLFMSDFSAAVARVTQRPDFFQIFTKGAALPRINEAIVELDKLGANIVDNLLHPTEEALKGLEV